MTTCATCVHTILGRRIVRCTARNLEAPRAALAALAACERHEQAADALNAEWVAPAVEAWPWTPPMADEADAPRSHGPAFAGALRAGGE